MKLNMQNETLENGSSFALSSCIYFQRLHLKTKQNGRSTYPNARWDIRYKQNLKTSRVKNP